MSRTKDKTHFYKGFGAVHNFSAHTTPKSAVDRIKKIYDKSRKTIAKLFDDFARGTPINRGSLKGACYPFAGMYVPPSKAKPCGYYAYGIISEPGYYGTTLTRPELFENYYAEQFKFLLKHHQEPIYVAESQDKIPLPFVVDQSSIAMGPGALDKLRHLFPMPDLSRINDDLVDRAFDRTEKLRPLALFPAERVDFSLHRLKHYTGTNVKYFQQYILLTNYERYVTEFVNWAKAELQKSEDYTCVVEPGNVLTPGGNHNEFTQGVVPGHLPQMPAYHLVGPNHSGITLVNIGVGPSNAKTITDHLAVLRPHCWIMLGHCGGLRETQQLGDYVLAHGYARLDNVLDDNLPAWIPVPPVGEIQQAIQMGIEMVTGLTGQDFKARVRTGTVATTDNRNWELLLSQLNEKLKQSRSIAIDMESATIAANGFRYRVPYGTLLCVSDKPIHGEIKLPGLAQTFYRERISQHLFTGLETIKILKKWGPNKFHSRKLRGFDEPPFR